MNMLAPNAILNGLGQTGESAQLPAHYLVPMSKTAINIFIGEERAKGPNSTYASGCDKSWVGYWGPCLITMLEIERHNLLYVNGFITYDELVTVYKKAQEALAAIPANPTLKEQLKNTGKFLIGTITGFITAGPVGLFTGGAAAAGKILADAKAQAMMQATSLIQSAADLQKVEAARQAQVQAQASSTIPGWAIWTSAGLTAALLGYSYVSQKSK